MKTFQHRFESVEKYLHHRAPYLMVEKIEAIEKHEIVTTTHFSGEEFFVAGHFPGAPILPGAMMQEMTTQSAGILIAAEHNPMESFDTEDPFFNEFALGVLVKVSQSRFRGFARPGDSLKTRVTLNEVVGNMFDFSGEVSVGENQIMRNSFRLTNILSSKLQGKANA